MCDVEQLSAEQKEQYRIEGYVVLDSFFPRHTLDKIDAAVQSLVDRPLTGEDMSKILELEPEPVDGRRVPRRIYSPFHQHEEFRQLATDPGLLRLHRLRARHNQR